MSKIYDLSKYLEEAPSIIKLGDDEYEVEDRFSTLLKLDELANSREDTGSMEFVKEFLTLALGEEAKDKLIDKNYKLKVYMKIIECIQDVYKGDKSEESASSQP